LEPVGLSLPLQSFIDDGSYIYLTNNSRQMLYRL
jgi:hypothetical protein